VHIGSPSSAHGLLGRAGVGGWSILFGGQVSLSARALKGTSANYRVFDLDVANFSFFLSFVLY